ncbi:hypothetical protein AB0M28_40465 [Streptomyces sp. NPDC051940]|uniref:hypothetical protein n=1 Tax=Streptomyces sp. NPDC051940 TaxID=3155675 RepID=UPI003433CDC6
MTGDGDHRTDPTRVSGPVGGAAHDHVDRLVDAARQACRDLGQAVADLDAFIVNMGEACREHFTTGVMLRTDGAAVWATFQDTVKSTQERLSDLRTEVFRTAVEEAGITYAEIARRTGHSRQLVARVAKSSRPETGPC